MKIKFVRISRQIPEKSDYSLLFITIHYYSFVSLTGGPPAGRGAREEHAAPGARRAARPARGAGRPAPDGREAQAGRARHDAALQQQGPRV